MDSTLQEQTVQTRSIEWSNSELCILISNRMATLLKQIGAYCITKDCQFSFEQIRERLAMFGETVDETQSEAIFELLHSLTKNISEGDIAVAIYEVISAAKENLEEIKNLVWAGNPDLARDVEKALKSNIGKEEGMKALIIGLVHEIISLFGLELKELISVIKAKFPEVFLDWQAIEEFAESTALSLREFEREEPTQLLDDYLNVISDLNFPRYFPYQPLKGEEYKDVTVTVRAVSDLLNSHKHWRNTVDLLESKIRDLKSTYENDKVLLVEEKAELFRKKSEMAVEIIKLMSENATLSEENDQLREKRASQMEEIETMRIDKESALADLAARNSGLESKLTELSEKRDEADKTIRNLSKKQILVSEQAITSLGPLISQLLLNHFRGCLANPDQLAQISDISSPIGIDRMIQINKSGTNTQPPSHGAEEKK